MRTLLKTWLQNAGYHIRVTKPEQVDAFFAQKKMFNPDAQLTIFDVGAHHGETSLAYQKLFPQATIYAFEPFEASMNSLKKNINGTKQIFPQGVALSQEVGETTFHSNSFSATNSLLATAETETMGYFKTQNVVKIQTNTLDNFAQNNQIAHIDILKMDVQGAEHLVLRGAEKMLKQQKISLIYTEIIVKPSYDGQKSLDEMLTLVRSFGYNLYGFYNYLYGSKGEVIQLDALFTSPKFSIS